MAEPLSHSIELLSSVGETRRESEMGMSEAGA